MDAVNYIEKAKSVLQDEIEEAMLDQAKRMNDIEVTDEEIL